MSDARDWQALSLSASQVFTPTSPIDEKSLFAGRNKQIVEIIDVINQKGQHAILYGERGVGKTSLVNVLAAFLGNPSIIAPRVNCDVTDDFSSVWLKAFEQVNLNRQPRVGPGFTASPQIDAFDATSLLGQRITPNSVAHALQNLSQIGTTIVILDEFDRLQADLRRAFADTIKTLSDQTVNATVLLVGVADSVNELIQEHQSVERALMQIQVPRMSSAEIRQIIATGTSKLGMTITDGALRQVAKLAQGLPHYAHLLGLHAVRAAIEMMETQVNVESVRKAISRALSGTNQSIRTSYETAVRSARKNNLFADVLLSCALSEVSDLGYFAAQDVRTPLRQITKVDYEIPTFAQHLNEFCDRKRGPVLQKIGTRRLFRYRFINPLLQPFVIMQGLHSNRISSDLLDSPSEEDRPTD